MSVRVRGRGRFACSLLCWFAAIVTLAAWTGLRYVERSYYVSESDGTVAVYNGIPHALGPFAFLTWWEYRYSDE